MKENIPEYKCFVSTKLDIYFLLLIPPLVDFYRYYRNGYIIIGCDFLLKYTQIYPHTPKYTQIHHKIVCIVLVKGSVWIIFHKKFKFHKFVTRVIKMINFITIINIDTPTWPLPQIQMYPKTQNSYGTCMCYLHTTQIFLPTLFQLFYLFILFLYKNIYENGKLSVCSFFFGD